MKHLLIIALLLSSTLVNAQTKHKKITRRDFNVYVDSMNIIVVPKEHECWAAFGDHENEQKDADEGGLIYQVSYDLFTWSHGMSDQPYACYFDSGRGMACKDKKSFISYLSHEMNEEIMKCITYGKYNFSKNGHKGYRTWLNR